MKVNGFVLFLAYNWANVGKDSVVTAYFDGIFISLCLPFGIAFT